MNSIVATRHYIKGELLDVDEACLSEVAWRTLGARGGDEMLLSHMEPLEFLGDVRSNIYSHRLNGPATARIARDVTTGSNSDSLASGFERP